MEEVRVISLKPIEVRQAGGMDWVKECGLHPPKKRGAIP